MITRDLTITVNNNVATLSEPVTVYRGDRGIQLNCKIMQYKFKFNRSTLENVINYSTGLIYARVLVHKPHPDPDDKENGICFEVPMAAVDDDIVVITITKDWLDHETEVGTYKLQIQLYGEDYENERITIPPVEFNVEDVLCPETPENFNVFSDKVGVAVAGLLEIKENGEQYNSDYANGVYNATKWGSGDVVTANSLNKMEDAIEYSVSQLSNKATHEEVNEIANQVTQLQTKHNQDVTAINNKIDTDIQNAINSLVETHNADVTTINNKIANDIEVAINELEAQHDADVATINNKINKDIQTAIDELEAQHNSDVTTINNKINTDIQNAKQQLTAQHNLDVSEINATIISTKAELQGNINTLSAVHSADVTNINNNMNTMKNDLEGDIESLETKHNQDVSTINTNVTNLGNTLNKRVDDLTSKHNADVETINNKINTDIQNAKDELTATHNQDVVTINKTINDTKVELQGNIDTLSQAHANDLASVNKSISDLDKELEDNVTSINNKIANDIEVAINELTTQHNSDVETINNKIANDIEAAIKTDYHGDLLTDSKTIVGAINDLYKMVYQLKNGLPYPKSEYYVEYTICNVASSTEVLTALQDGYEDDEDGFRYKYLPYNLSLTASDIEILYGSNENNCVVINGSSLHTLNANYVRKIRIYYPSTNNMLQAAFSCRSIRTIEYVNMTNITWAGAMFSGCKDLYSVNGMENFRNAKDVGRMFYECSSLAFLNLSRLNTSGLYSEYNYEDMFTGVPSYINWQYDDTDSKSYANFKLTEEQTGFSGKFPWNQE